MVQVLCDSDARLGEGGTTSWQPRGDGIRRTKLFASSPRGTGFWPAVRGWMMCADTLTVAESTWHRWLSQYGGMKANDAKRLKELEAQNARLKKLVANQALDIDMLKGVGGGKRLTPNRRRGVVVVLHEQFGVSERRACRVVGKHRSTQRLLPPVVNDQEWRLREFLFAHSKERPRWGWRCAWKDAWLSGVGRQRQTGAAPVAPKRAWEYHGGAGRNG